MNPARIASPTEFLSTRRLLLRTLGLAGSAAFALPWRALAQPLPRERLRVGEFHKIYDPSVGESKRWYINDHTFIRAEDGLWHLFGITHREPANPDQEKYLAHATAPALDGPWTKHPPVMFANKKYHERVVWAPYVLRHDGLYWMYYCAGGWDHAHYRIFLATSRDLWTWERCPQNPMVVDGYDTRDPMVLRYQDKWLLYYPATSTPQGGNHTVKAAFSTDLIHWSQQQEVFRDAEVGTYGGPTESPFVVERQGRFYLFVCTNRGADNYNETAVYESNSPLHWEAANLAGKFRAHAAEVIATPEGKWYVSSAGWGQGGVYLAELTWMD
jgi:beta-fructofuranosidase